MAMGGRRACVLVVLLVMVEIGIVHLHQSPPLMMKTAVGETEGGRGGGEGPKLEDLQQQEDEEEGSGVSAPQVYVEGLGTARGRVLKSFLGREFYAFMSIPYAMPPVGDRRFKYPEPWTGKWDSEVEGDYEATWLRARCPQESLIRSIVGGREDCLHVSIYTPKLKEELGEGVGLPVMFWIHGGSYMTGDANLYVPTKLMDRDVMVVVVQYRLGTLGFLAGGTPEAPGNMGLMDQIEALRWIQKYIQYFGGDPDKVTVFGQSAGGASASWLQMTSLTNETTPNNNGRQLLHRVIPESGSSLEIWTIDDNPEKSFMDTATLLDCAGEETNNTDEMIICMRSRSFQEIAQASLTLYGRDRRAGGLGFKGLCPVIQSGMEDSGIELVIPEDPRTTLQKGDFLKIPVMTGSVRDEGSLVIGLTYKDFLYPNGHTTNDTEFMRDEAVHTLINAFGIDDKNGAVTNTMQVGYFPNAIMGEWDTMVGGMIDMGGVMFLKSGLWEAVHAMYKAAPEVPVYFYSWEFESDDSLFPWIFLSMPDVPVHGDVAHTDELLYLFHLPADMDHRQKVMVNRMVTLWTNFAKYGNPTPQDVAYEGERWKGEVEEWRPFTLEGQQFMLITDNFTMNLDYTKRWNYHRDLVDPTTEPPSTTPNPHLVDKDAYDKQVREKEQFQIATGILGGVCVCTLALFIVVSVKLRKKTNAIV
ncbi:esterase FE4-like [Homarus americanus]|uniref:esterase FE4-like n=1 Tax=Homarus americanus TaxID=6706 RepID=UPI001C44085B|nr:esterase FE4-like [Homarus americanus]XP_042203072.1 esterase FE4-like [Homarus americanus]